MTAGRIRETAVHSDAVDAASLAQVLGALSLRADDRQIEELQAFETRLYEANRIMNLTRVPRDEFLTRHVADSLLVQDLIPARSMVLDIGAGPGFPAWPLACLRPDLRVTALDSSSKCVRFLRGSPLPNLEVVPGRAEEWGARDRFDFVTGRALAPLPIQLELSASPCKVGGAIVPIRSAREALPSDPNSFAELGLVLEAVESRTVPTTDIVRALPVFRKVRPTPRRFPRPWPQIRSSPLIPRS
jgi:16S rRNA (guanine527-N7)-methyltransferase